MSMAAAGGSATAARGPPRVRPRLVSGALHSLLLAAVALFFLNFNVAGTATPSKRFSQDLVYAWFGDESWLYPRTTSAAAAEPHAPPQVVVVMLNERALALRGARWPAPLQFHTQMLSELEVLRPRAILLDFLLIDPAPHEDTCAFLATAARLRSEHIPLYLAVTRADDLAHMDAAGCRDERGTPLRVAATVTPVSVQRQADDSDFVNRRYPFELRDTAAPAGSGIASAALRMYCDTAASPADCLASLTRERPANAGFELAWSPQGDPFNQRWAMTACTPTTSPMDAVLNQPALPRESGCPPVATVFGSALLNPDEDPTLTNERLFRLAGGSFVMIGGNFRGSGDLITTPLHTLLPGVYYHAVALQNLLAFDGHPKIRKEFRSPKLLYYCFDLLVLWLLAAIFLWRQHWVQPGQVSPFGLSDAARGWIAPFIARYPPHAWILTASVLLLFMAANRNLQLIAVSLIIVALVGIELRVAGAGEVRARVRGIVLYFAAIGVSLAVIVLAVWVGYRWLRLPPGDWLGYFSFAAFGFFVAHTAIIEFGRRIDELYLERLSTQGNAAK
jgi:CHASE2 domain